MDSGFIHFFSSYRYVLGFYFTVIKKQLSDNLTRFYVNTFGYLIKISDYIPPNAWYLDISVGTNMFIAENIFRTILSI